MVAIVTGSGHGLERSSLALLGAAGKIGNAELGRGGQNVYVNAATGTLNVQRQDEFLVGRGPDADLATEFSTGQPFWHTPNWRAVFGLTGTVNTAGSTITRSTSFNDWPVYTYDVARGAYVNKEGAGAHDEVRFANGVWSYTDGNTRTVEYYEQQFYQFMLVSRIVDADGNAQTYNYDSTNGCIARITNADGSYVEMTNTNWRPNEIKASYVNESGGISTMTRVRYTWDPANIARLMAITVDLTPHDNSIADGNVYRIDYEYDGSTQRLKSIIQTDGSRLDIAYDTSGRVLSLTEHVAAGVTRVTSFSYDTVNRITTVTDANLQSTQLWYDAQLRLTKIVSPPAAAGAAPQTQLFAYNADGDVVSVTDPANNVTAFQYDANGNEIWRQDSLGNIVTRTYGSRNELLTETRVEGSAQTFTTSGFAPTVTGDKILGTGLANEQWGSATTVQTLSGSAVVSGRRYHPYNGYSFLGLSDAPLSTSQPWNEYDFAFYFFEGSIHIFENGSLVSSPVPNGASDAQFCQIEYDGAKVVYRIDGYVVHQTTTAGGRTFHAGVSANFIDRGVQDFLFAPVPAATTRYVYDSENHLRYLVNAEGEVTEYRYSGVGQQVAELVYAEHSVNVAGLPAKQTFTEAALNAWVSSLVDKSSVKRTNTYYDARGQVSSVVSYSALSKFGEGPESPLAITAGANATVAQGEDGLYRVTKTSGGAPNWDADAHSSTRVEGDFVLRLRPGQRDKHVIGGMAAAPAASAYYTNPDYGFYFLDNGPVYYMEKGVHLYLGVYYNANDSFWLTRVGSTISYYKGETLEAAMTAGALRTVTGSSEALYFDSSLHDIGAVLDVGLTRRGIVSGLNTTVTQQADDLYRIVKTSGSAANWDSAARSTAKADGDFVLRIRPGQTNMHTIGGVTAAPGANAAFENVHYGFYFNTNATAYWAESGYHDSLGVTFNPGDDFWLVRAGTTISYYKGATLEAAMAAGALRTRTGAGGTLYFDSSFYSTGATMEVAFTPATMRSMHTTITPQADGLQRVTKTSGGGAYWDAAARSTAKAEGDFVVRLRPGQTNMHVIGGVTTAPEYYAAFENVNYGFYFNTNAIAYWAESGYHDSLGVTFNAGDDFWLVRVGTTISYYKGATLEAAVAAGALRTRTGVSATLYFDSSYYSTGATMDVAFTPAPVLNRVSSEVSRTNFVYDPAGQLLSRVTDGQLAETFVYDGLGRVVSSTDRNRGTTNIVFNHSEMQTVVTLASGLVQTSTYDKAGNLVSFVESGGSVASATTASKYDKLGRLRMTTDATGFHKYFVYDKVGRLVAEVNHRGDLVEYRYDANDRLVATARYTAGVTGANLAILADPNSTIEMSALRPSWHPWDIWTWRTYDKEGRLTSTMDGTIRTYEYDKADRLVKTVAYYNGLSWDQIQAFQANPPTAPVIPAADARDSVSRNFYDKAGRLVAALDGEGYLTRSLYDRAGQLVEKIAYFNPSPVAARASGTLNQLIAGQTEHSDDRRTRFAYDGQGQLRFEIDALNHVTEYGYDGAGQLISTIRHAGSIPWWADCTYDNVKALVAAPGFASAAETRKSWNVHDESGRIAFSIASEGAVTRFSYDTMGRVTKTVQFAATRETTAVPTLLAMNNWANAQSGNAANRITRTYHSLRGDRRFTVDAEGFLSRTDFDAAGRTTGEYRWDLPVAADDSWTIDTVTNAYAGGWTGKTYGYSYGGELTDFHNGEGNWTGYNYYQNGTRMLELAVLADESYTYFNHDVWGRETARFDANASPDAATTQYGRDGHGNLNLVIDPRNNATTRTFDHLGRVLTETDALNGITRYEYNAFGEVTKVTDARGNITTHSYDKLGRLLTTTDALNYVTSNSYSDFGDLETVTRGSATTTFEYDRAGRVWKTIDAEGHYEQYGLNAFGDRVSVRNKIGGTVYNEFDRRGLLKAETLPMASINAEGAVIATSVTNRFEYDSRGNRTKRIEAFGLPEARTTRWVYDKADRLIETRGDDVLAMSQTSHNDFTLVTPTEKLKYDSRGRVIEKTDALGGRTLYYYDKMSRVKAEIGPAGTYSAFTYDANGNMLTRRIYGTAVALPGAAGGTPPSPPAGEYRETSYSYDALNRLKTTSVALIRTGAWNGVSQYETSAWSTVTTTLDYDSNGNVVRTVDGNNNASFAYYDRLNRKIAEVDREGYLTYLTLDGEGNVAWEQRYATALGGVTTASDPDALRGAAGEARSTEFWYDKNGRRRFERRYGVPAYAVDPTTGALSGPTAAVAMIEYSYNGLGEVLRKTEANGDYVDYDYDLAGRLTRERRAPFVDNSNIGVRPMIDYSYDGLNALTRTRQGGETVGGTDRVTRYYYGAGGRLGTMYDANGAYYQYYYDAAGNVVRESYYRYRWNNSYTLDSLLYTRDQLGRVTSQGLATWTGTGWDRGDAQTTAYNAYGDVAQRGLNNVWQEQFHYDSAGRLWKSNAGDGVWRFFLYDGAGNQTLTIESEGADLAYHDLEQVLAIASANYATYLGNYYADGINVTIAQFDRRGQQIGTRLPFRQLAGSTMATLTSARTHNAYGEVTSETDMLGRTTSFLYNAMGRLIEKQSPFVDYTTESGATGNARPTEKYYYDVSGRLIATEDANGNRIRRALLAGTGHGGSEALVASEFHADGGVFKTFYDVFGDARRLVNEVNEEETRHYDAMGRLTVQTHHGLTDYYGYDLLGQRLWHWNTLLGQGNIEYTNYDAQGRVTYQVTLGGDSTQTDYAWSSSLATYGMATYGGWTETTTYANGRQLIEQSDRFGRVVWKQDLGGHVFSSTYDAAGRLIQRSGPETLSWSYYNTGLAYSVDNGAGNHAIYGYDAAGNKTSEYTVKAYAVVQNATATYDELGRLKSWAEAGGAVSPASSTSYRYDLVGNIRHTHSVQAMLDVQGANVHAPVVDYWYRYDAMNRVTTDKGGMSGTNIVGGTSYTYDAAGRRKTSTTSGQRSQMLWKYRQPNGVIRWYTQPPQYYIQEGGTTTLVNYSYTSAQLETYEYDSAGHLHSVAIATQSIVQNNMFGDLVPVVGGLGAAVTRAVYTHDAMGRATAQSDYLDDGTTVAYSRSVLYNAKGQVTDETTNTRQGSDTWTSVIHNEYGSGTSYALGAAVTVATTDSKNGVYQYQTTTTNGFAWYDGAVQSTVSFARTGATTSNSSYSYGGSGQLASISVVDGVRNRTITFTTDMLGQVIRRDEADDVTTGTYSGDPHEVWYRYNGRQIAFTGNNGTLDADYAASIAARTKAPVGNYAFRHGDWNGPAVGDYDPSLAHINSYSQGSAGGGYTVRAGDTLAGIALALWGDSALWYKLAEANGLSGAAGLIEGRNLIVPAGVQANHHNSSTLKPYDPAEVIGNTSPSTPKPQKKGGKCGTFGIILLVAIAVAVTVVTSGAAVAALSSSVGSIGAGIGTVLGLAGAASVPMGTMIAAGVVGGAVGSMVSQGVGVATGIQDKFSWKNVAMAGLSGGIGAGLGAAFPAAGGTLGAIGRGAFLGASGSILTQGVATLVGLQKKFDFAGVAAAGLGGAASAAAGSQLGGLNRHLAGAISSSASGIVNAATRSLINGTDFGDNLMAALPDIIGSTLGNMLADGLAGTEGRLPSFLRDSEIMSDPHRLADVLQRKYKLTAEVAAEEAAFLSSNFSGGIDPFDMGRGASGAPYDPQSPVQRRAYDAVIAQGRPAGEAADVARLVAVKEQIDTLTGRLPRYRQIMPGMVRPLRNFSHHFDRMLLSADVYFDQSIPDLLPTGYRRLGPNELRWTGLGPHRLNDSESGYFAAIYESDSGKFIYANRGTDSRVDWWANIGQEKGYETRQYELAIDNAITITLLWPNQVEFVGHSLGGGLATAQALVTNHRATVFNPATLHPATIGTRNGRPGTDFSNANRLITGFFVWGEAVGAARWALGLNPFRGRSEVLRGTTAPRLDGNGEMVPGQTVGRVRSLANGTEMHSILSMAYAMTSRFYSAFAGRRAR